MSLSRITAWLTLAFALCVQGLAHAAPGSKASGNGGHVMRGKASWYGRAHHGRKTASGRPFNMFALTAAHKTLPFGTRLRVFHEGSGRTVDVVIDDRGPYVRGRIIDLSRRAAERLGILQAGIADVRLERLPLRSWLPPDDADPVVSFRGKSLQDAQNLSVRGAESMAPQDLRLLR